MLPPGDTGGAQSEVIVVSDGTGDTATAAVKAVMLQFQADWKLRVFGGIRHESEVRRVVDQPGLLHGISDEYFERIDAVEFAVRHDDGANVESLFEADIVLVGVSRTSKTPLSMYLAQRGYKTGNVPLIYDLDPPKALSELDSRKIFGLIADHSTLLTRRINRLKVLRASSDSPYTDSDAVELELRRARQIFRERRSRTIDITGRAVEETAARILDLYHSELG